jgi:hypothetical protein
MNYSVYLFEVLRYKPEGRGIDSWWGPWILFAINLTFPAALWSRVHSPYNRNECQEFSWVKVGRRVTLTTSPPTVSRLYRECGVLDVSHNPVGLRGLLLFTVFINSHVIYIIFVYRYSLIRTDVAVLSTEMEWDKLFLLKWRQLFRRNDVPVTRAWHRMPSIYEFVSQGRW